jgi:hypothetical protein
MAFTTCNSCGKEVSPKAKNCPHCGQPKPWKKKPSAKRVLIGLVLVIFAVIMISNIGGESDKSASPGPEAKPAASAEDKLKHELETACYIARSFVRKKLKVPGSAEFPLCSEVQTWRVPKQEGVYRSQGYVDSKNTFGVMVRTQYVCTVKDIGNEKWALVGIEVMEQ